MMRYLNDDSFNWMMGNGWGMMAGWGILGWISLFLYWTLMVLGIMALIKFLTGDCRKKDHCFRNHKEDHHNQS